MEEEDDKIYQIISDYVIDFDIEGNGLEQAKLCLFDSLACGCLALNDNNLNSILGPIMPWEQQPQGCRVPGTFNKLGLLKATFDLGVMINWQDYNDAFIGQEYGNPSVIIAPILMLADCLVQEDIANFKMIDILTFIVKAYEIYGKIAQLNVFNAYGIDNVILIKLVTAIISCNMLGGGEKDIKSVISNVFIDGHPLKIYRHGKNINYRKSWAAADSAMRGLFLAWLIINGKQKETRCALTDPRFGFNKNIFKEHKLILSNNLNFEIMAQIMLRPQNPGEIHAQSAIEAAANLSPFIKDRVIKIKNIIIKTQSMAWKNINNIVLDNPAARENSLQYMVVVALLAGGVEPKYYSNFYVKRHPLIEELLSKVQVIEEHKYTDLYYSQQEKTIANSIAVEFSDNSTPLFKEVLYPLGHPKRRREAQSCLYNKYKIAINDTYKDSAKKLQLLSYWDMAEKKFLKINFKNFITDFWQE